MEKLLPGIDDIITIPIPADRSYVSPKSRNGYEDQRISTCDLDYNTLKGEFAGFSISHLGEIYLRYVMDAVDFQICFEGLRGFENFSGEIFRICQLLKQEGIYHIRSITISDFPTKILEIYRDYWISNIKINSATNPDFHTYYVSYVESECQYSTILFDDFDNRSRCTNSLGVRPVVYVPLPEGISRSEVFDLVDESFVTWE